MSYTTTPGLGLQLPVPGSGQAWQTSVYNSNLSKIDQAIRNLQYATGRPRTGRTTITQDIGAGSSRTVTANFPSGQFTAAPNVVASATSSRINAAINDVDANQVTFAAGNWTSNIVNGTVIHWYAIPAS